MITRFDHVYSYLKDNDLDACYARFSRAGFLMDERRMRHPKGHLTGFVEMTGTYLEFLSVVDEQEFEREADPENRIFRSNPQPFGIGAVCTDPQLIFDRLAPIYPELKKPYSRGEQGKPEGPVLWTFCPLPHQATPGADVFPLMYHRRQGKKYELKVGPNTIFALGGVWLCSDSIEGRMDVWKRTLKPVTQDFRRLGRDIEFGAQKLSWISEAEYKTNFKDAWTSRSNEVGDICAVRLLAKDLSVAQKFLEKEGFAFLRDGEDQLITAKDANTGYAFVIERSDSEIFLTELNRSI